VIYADAILLIIHGPTHETVITTVEVSLNTIEEWCSKHKLELSKGKTAIMPMFVKKIEIYNSHPGVNTRGINVVTEMKYFGVMLDSRLDWYPHTLFLENKILHNRNNLARCSKVKWGLSYANLTIIYKHAILPTVTHAAEDWYCSITKRTKHKLKQIQRTYFIFLTKAYISVSNDALQAIAGIMPIDQAISLYKATRAITRDQQTNAIIAQLKKIETPTKLKGVTPTENHIQVVLSGEEGLAEVTLYTDESKTDKHVEAGMVAMKESREIHT
jgi:hypothetical protein